MKPRNWNDLMNSAFAGQKFLCVGLDPVYEKIPHRLKSNRNHRDDMRAVESFCIEIIQAVGSTAGFLKPNWAFFLQFGTEGLLILEEVIRYSKSEYPDMAIILDCKVGDIGTTNAAYARCFFDQLGADAITMHGYLGRQANQTFLDHANKGFFVLCHTSNPGAEEFQRLRVDEDQRLYQKLAGRVQHHWNANRNCGLVAGATFPDALRSIRNTAPSLPLLVPGIGTQGGDLQAAVTAAKDSHGAGFIINAASSIIFADDPRAAASTLDEKIRAM